MSGTSSEKSDASSIGPVKQFGRFTLFKKLATGGMAEIWLARQSGLAGFNRFVVIKKILSHLAEEETFIRMFQDEARMSAQLTHPNIVQVYDLGETQGTFYIAMEYIAGENLAAITWRGVKRDNRFTPAFAARTIADACKALNYAHHLKGTDGTPYQIVHRDISPQNLLVTYEGEVKVVDFGIAKAATKSQHTKTGMLKGKFSYMSPEQCRGGIVDMRSDVFALGIVLYELCTGKRLFKHESELMILEMITQRRVTPPSQVAPEVPSALEEIIMRALEKEPDARFATAQDMQIALEDYLRAEKAPTTNADIARYMRGLFNDKMEEKRNLCRIAARDDFMDVYGTQEDEATEEFNVNSSQAPKRKIVYGRPSDIRVAGFSGQQQVAPQPTASGQFEPSSAYPPRGTNASHSGTAPRMMSGSVASGSYHGSHPGMMQSHSGVIPVPSPWPTRIIFIAILVILVSGAYVASELLFPEPPPPPPKVAKPGKIELDSIPSGGLILVNGQPVKLEDGRDALTPIEQLEPLYYGESYTLEIILAGYEPYKRTIVMGTEFDQKLLKPKLVQIAGEIITMVRGEPGQVRVFINDEEVGYGGKVISKSAPGQVTVAAKADDHSCKATPSTFRIKQDQSVRVIVNCEKNIVKTVKREGTRTTRPTERTSRPSQSSSKSGCQSDASAPPGFATIQTIPFSEVWYRGKKVGDTPLNKVKLPAGCNELTFIHGGKETKRTKKKIQISPNQTQRYRIKLQ